MISVFIHRLAHGQDLPLPLYASEDAAGLDICAAMDLSIAPFERKLVPTGFALALPQGYEAQIRPRSGLALKYGITILNSPGTIDADYRGEVRILLINLGQETFSIAVGDRIAQMVIAPLSRVHFQETDALPLTERGARGFGSTGVKS